MGVLSLKETLVLFSVYLSGECRITRVRETLLNTTDHFSGGELRNDLPEYLDKLLQTGWLCKRDDKFYSCRRRFSYKNLRRLSGIPAVRKILTYCEQHPEGVFDSHSLPQEYIDSVCLRCYEFAVFRGDTASACRILKIHQARYSKYYYYVRYSPCKLPLQATMDLMAYPEFRAEFLKMPEEMQKHLFFTALPAMVCSGTPLPDWRKWHSEKGPQTPLLPFLLAAFWENDKDFIKKHASASPEIELVCTGLAALLEGDLSLADKSFTSYLNKNCEDDPSSVLLVIMALFPASVTGAAITRVNRWIEFLKKTDLMPYPLPWQHLGMLYQACRHEPYPFTLSCDHTLAEMIYFLAASQMDKTEISSEECLKAVGKGKDLLAAGHVVAGIWLLNAAGSLLLPDAPERQEIETLTQASGVVPLFKLGHKLPEWARMLNVLEKIFPEPAEKPKETKASQKIVAWHLTADPLPGHGNSAKRIFRNIEIFSGSAKRSGRERGGKNISLSQFVLGRVDELLTPEELSTKSFIKNDPENNYFFTAGVLDRLVDSQYVFIEGCRVKLQRENNTIISALRGDRQIELSLKYSLPEEAWDNEKKAFLDLAEPEICRYCLLEPRDPLLTFFRQRQNKEGKLLLPEEALPHLQETVAKISHSVSFSGFLAEMIYQDLPRRQGDQQIHVLLKRYFGGLQMDFRVKPLDECSWFVRPGIGHSEKVMETPEKCLVIRDLEAEKQLFSEKLDAISLIPESVRETHSFEVKDLADSLLILAELKKAGVILEWREGTPLRISRQLGMADLNLYSKSAGEWFSIGGRLQISEDTILSLRELLEKLGEKQECFIPLDENSYLQLTQDLIQKLEILNVSGTAGKEFLKLSPAALPMLATTFEEGLPEAVLKRLEELKTSLQKEIAMPAGLQGTLRSYQEEGIRYLARMADCRLGCCLADDMGLGKTVQLLGLMLREAPQGAALVVCPASLCRTWKKEAARFTPSLRVQILPVNNREEVIAQAGPGDVILCSYGVIHTETALFSSKEWHIVILDEAQAIKNNTTRRAHSVKKLKAEIRIASTGTPVENSLMDLWSIFDFLDPGLLGNQKGFENLFCRDDRNLPLLKKLTAPLIMRRKKEDVLDDLPEKTEIVLSVDLSEKERTEYELLRREALESLEKNEKSKIAILAQLTRLRRFCCDHSLIWSDFPPGTKLQRILELAEELKKNGHKALIFSQYVTFLQLIRKSLEEGGFSCQYLDGETPLAVREKRVDDFQKGEGDFFLISLKAGGTGLTLTAANYVILADPWWNPAVEAQAADRAHRIGQKEPVTVYRMIASDTVEEKIVALHETKRSISEDILENAPSTALSAEELLALFEP